MCVCVRVCVFVCVVCACMCVYVGGCVCVHVCVCVYMLMCTCVTVCLETIYTYTNTQTIFTCLHTHNKQNFRQSYSCSITIAFLSIHNQLLSWCINQIQIRNTIRQTITKLNTTFFQTIFHDNKINNIMFICYCNLFNGMSNSN